MEKMDQTIHALLDAITDNQSHEKIIHLQQEFSQSVEKAMDTYKAGRIQVEIIAMPHTMYHWATKELPLMIQEPSNLLKIRKRLLLFCNIIDYILHPKESIEK